MGSGIDLAAGAGMQAHFSDIVALLILAIPVAAISWTVTHEEILREPREYCVARSRGATSWPARKFFYVFTCEFCFSHWVALTVVGVTEFGLLRSG